MKTNMRDKSKVNFPVGVGVDMIAPMPADRVLPWSIGAAAEGADWDVAPWPA